MSRSQPFASGGQINTGSFDFAYAELQRVLAEMVDHVDEDANTIMSRRLPEKAEIEQLFWYAFEGRSVDF